MLLFWLSLGVAGILTVSAAIYLTLKALEAFRDFKRLGRRARGELARIEQANAAIERHLALATESGTRLEASLARLGESRARLNVLTSALADARASLDRLTGIVPRKK
jgi:hypothetical protein